MKFQFQQTVKSGNIKCVKFLCYLCGRLAWTLQKACKIGVCSSYVSKWAFNKEKKIHHALCTLHGVRTSLTIITYRFWCDCAVCVGGGPNGLLGMGIGKSTTQLKWWRHVFIQTTCFGPGNGPSSGLHKCD
jgi:hypothetical protein